MASQTDPNLHLMPPDRANQAIAHFGFLLVHGDRQGPPGGTNLVIALREKPTLEHFDPERVMYWVVSGGRGRHVEYDRGEPAPFEARISWGTVRITDRLEVGNTFLTFGGQLSAHTMDQSTTVVTIGSSAPILRWTGHSQDVDPFAAEVAAFFARIRVPINFTPGAEGRIGDMSPLALYSAVIADLRARYSHAEALRDANPSMNMQLMREAHWLESSAASDWETGRQLLADLHVTPGG